MNELDKIRDQLKTLPDLERLISKIHQLGNVRKDHPESRAIMYENDVYSKKKIEDFITILNGFMNSNKLLVSLKDTKFKSKLLKSILTINTNDEQKKRTGFPYLDELLKFYNESFDAEKAKSEGKIIPSNGVNEDYDSAMSDLNDIEKKLKAHLKEKQRELNCDIKYFGTNKNRYQLEIPEHKCNKLSSEYELTSSKKGFKRYWTPEIKEFLQELTDAETRRDQALRDTTKSLFKNFDKHYEVWNRAVQCLSILDVLVSLATYVRNAPDAMCRPEIVVLDDETNINTPFIEIVNGRHPCLTKTFSGDFIPNDVLIGCEVII
jgi:DNA mismatch repair protein MSH6